MAHILLIEDDPLLAAGLAYNLEKQGHTTAQAASGAEGLAALAGALALVNRALGQKQGDRPRRKKAAEPPEQAAGTQEAPEPEQAEQTERGSAPAEADPEAEKEDTAPPEPGEKGETGQQPAPAGPAEPAP